MALLLLEKGLSRGGRSLGPLVRQMGGRLLPAAMGTGAFLYFHGRAPLDPALDVLVLVTCLFRDTACSTLETVTRRLIGPFRRRLHGRPAAATSSPYRRRSLKQWLSAPSRNEKDCRPSIFVHISHNPPPTGFSPASG